MAYIVSSGDTSSGIILAYDSMIVLDGGAADDTTVNYGGRIYVSGGTANRTTVNEGGVLHISSGGTAVSTTVNDGGMLNLSAGGTAGSTIVSEWGMMNVFLDGLADTATVESAGRLYVSSGGTATGAKVESAGYLYVSRGGTAIGATVKSGGMLYVSSGGTGVDIEAVSGACLNFYLAPGVYIAGTYDGSAFVIKDGAVSDYTVNGNCRIYVSSGCTADGVTVKCNGELRIRSGGTADGVTVNGGELYVQNGGAATDVVWTPCEGHVYVYDGGYATFVSEYSGVYYGSGNTLLSTAAVMDAQTLDADFEMYVMNGGTANGTTVNDGGKLYVSGGGTASGAAVNSGGSMNVCSGGTATDAAVNDGGRLYVSGGGTADHAAVNDGGRLYVSGGGTADHTAVNEGGRFYISNDGMAIGAAVNDDGEFNVCSGGTATGTTVNSGGELYVSSGGSAVGATVDSMGLIYVCNGGIATGILENGGYVYVGIDEDVTFLPNTIDDLRLENTSASLHSGTTANSATVNEDGRLQIRGGRAGLVTVNDGGVADVFSSSVVNSLTANVGGNIIIYGGGTATEILENGGYVDVNSNASFTFVPNALDGLELEDGRYATLHSNTSATNTALGFDGGLYVRGGRADHTTVNEGGELMVSEGLAESTTIHSGGSVFVVRNGTATHTTVDSGGGMRVSFGGKATDVAIHAGGGLEVGSGGYAIDITVDAGGNAFIGSNGTATDIAVCAGGSLKLGEGAVIQSTAIRSSGVITGHVDCRDVSFDPGATLQFDLSVISPGNESAPVDLAGLAETRDWPSFSLPVADSQEYGDYKLAKAAWGFEQKTISVCNSVMEFGSLSLDRSVVVGNREYTLNLNDGDLVLSVNAALPTQYVYLDFDGEALVRYSNPDLELSFDLSVTDPVFSEEQRAAVLSALSERYGKYNVAFTLERPEETEYSTLYFGVSSAFDEYGDFFGVAETYDGNDRNRSDNVFILLDSSYSDEQIVSVASHMLDRLMGLSYACSVDGTPAMSKYAESKALLSLSANWTQEDPYNKYCPIDPRTGDRCVVGCTNTAASQIIHYWLETGLLDLTLSLTDSDAYRSNANIMIESSDAPESGHLSFAETNELLQNFSVLDENCTAALCFGAGVIQQADYSSDETGTAWSQKLFVRAGFEKDEAAREYEFGAISSDYDIMAYELLHGRPVGVSLLKKEHAIVADGYDSSRNMFHLDFGWGDDSNRWYSIEELDDLRIYTELSGFAPAVSPDLRVEGLSTGADVVYLNEDVTLSFTVYNEGKEVSAETMAYVYCGDAVLGACGVNYISSGHSREFTCTVGTAPLQVGKNILTVKVCSQNGEGAVSAASVTIDCKKPPQTQIWAEIEEGAQYMEEYSADNLDRALRICGGTLAKDLYAGAITDRLAAVTSVGDVSMTIDDGTFSGNIYGASAVRTDATLGTGIRHTVDDVTLTITGGETSRGSQACIFAGGSAAGDATGTVYTVASVTTTISGGDWGAAAGGRGIFGGIMTSGVEAQVVGDVNLTISDGTMGNVCGGGWAQKAGAKSIVGDVNINISGGTTGSVYGGGIHSISGGTTEAGDVTITVSGGNITGAIYARGQFDGDTTGAANVIFSGAMDFDCDVFGYSYVGGTDSNAALNFSGYFGAFSGNIGGFNGISLDGDTAMTITTAADDVSNGAWEFDLSDRADALAGMPLLTWSTADFENDTIRVKFANDAQAQAGWNIAAVAEAFSGTIFDVEIGGAEIASDLAYNRQIGAGDYAGWGFELESGELKFKNLAANA